MCNAMKEVIEDYANEVTAENVKNMFLSGGSLELAIATFRNVSEEFIRKIYEDVMKVKPLA